MKAIILSLSDPSSDPRPKRAFALLVSMGFSVDLCSYRIKGNLAPRFHLEIPIDNSPFILKILRKALVGLGLLLLAFLHMPKAYIQWLISRWFRFRILENHLKNGNYDIILVEDIFFLPFAAKHKKRAKMIFDAREYYTRQGEDSIIFRLFHRPLRIRICKEYLKTCDTVVTVSDGLSKEYFNEFKIPSIVVRSTPDFRQLPVQRPIPGRLRMVHHGAAHRNRKIENMLKVMDLLDDHFTLDLYLTGQNEYIEELKNLSTGNLRICFHETVPFESILPTLNSYDIGFFFCEPTTFNLKHCLPNKLFEFIQARLMVAIGPSPDMASIVKRYNCGIVAKSFDVPTMARQLNGITADSVLKYKHNSSEAAKILNWDSERQRLEKIIYDLAKI